MAWRRVTDAQREAIRVRLPRRKRSPKGGQPRADARKPRLRPRIPAEAVDVPGLSS